MHRLPLGSSGFRGRLAPRSIADWSRTSTLGARWSTVVIDLRSVALFAALSCSALLGCEADDDATGVQEALPGDAPPASTPESPPASMPAAMPPPQPRELPLATPSLGGYTLVEAFPNAGVKIPSALVWPKVDGVAPFLLERSGRIVQLGAGAARTVLDFSTTVAMISEGGALGMALHPAFGDGSGPSPYVFVWYNAKGTPRNKQRLSRFTWNVATKSFDASSESVLVEEEEEKTEHNAGRIQFGPDGFLYFGNGDDINEANHQRLDRAHFAGI
jgi:glucose/arabinose dehydrogenase